MIVWLLSPFSPLPENGAHESRTTTLANGLQAAGHEVVWFSMDWDHRRKKTVDELVSSSLVKVSELGVDKLVPLAVSERQLGQASSLVKDSEVGTTSPTKIAKARRHRLRTILIPVPPYYKNISLRRFWSHRVWGNRLVRLAIQQVDNGKLRSPDLILASSPPLDAPRSAFRLQKHFGCKVKIDLTDLWPHTFSRILSHLPSSISYLPLSPLYRQAHKQWGKADGVSAMSQEYLDEVLRIAPEQDTHLCYIGGRRSRPDLATEVETTKIHSEEDREVGTTSPTSPTSNSHLPSPTPKASFLYLGALTASYDFDTLFAAAVILAAEDHDFHIHIAGSGPLEEKLKSESGNRKLEGVITFHGFLKEAEMNALCEICDVGLNIIQAGLHITMPHKLNDYLCTGLAVINSLSGEAELLLDTSGAGLTYPAGNAIVLAKHMRTYILTPDAKKAAQKAAWKLAYGQFNREVSYPRWVGWGLK